MAHCFAARLSGSNICVPDPRAPLPPSSLGGPVSQGRSHTPTARTARGSPGAHMLQASSTGGHHLQQGGMRMLPARLGATMTPSISSPNFDHMLNSTPGPGSRPATILSSIASDGLASTALSRAASLPDLAAPQPRSKSGLGATVDHAAIPPPPIVSQAAARRSSLPFDFSSLSASGDTHAYPPAPSVARPTTSMAAAVAAARARRSSSWLLSERRCGGPLATSMDGGSLRASGDGETMIEMISDDVGPVPGISAAFRGPGSRGGFMLSSGSRMAGAEQAESGGSYLLPCDPAHRPATADAGNGSRSVALLRATSFSSNRDVGRGSGDRGHRPLQRSKSRSDMIAAALRGAGVGASGGVAAAGGNGTRPSGMLPNIG